MPLTSLSIATQFVRRCPCRNHLHNLTLRVTIRPLETRNASCPAPVNIHREPGGKRFWPHRLPQTASEHTETAELRASKSNWNQIKRGKNHYKQAEKIFSKSLGPSGRGFEPLHSDQINNAPTGGVAYFFANLGSNPRALGKAPVALCNPRWAATEIFYGKY